MSELNGFKRKLLSCLLMPFIWNITGNAAETSQFIQDIGRVSMQGSIIDTPCAINTADIEQSIDMHVTTVGEVLDNGYGQSRTFSVVLVNCILDPSKSEGSYFRTTFDGQSEDGLFSVSGAKGVGLQIADMAGNIAIPGKALPAGLLAMGTQRLDYTLRLVRNRDPLTSGVYNAVIRFKLDYF